MPLQQITNIRVKKEENSYTRRTAQLLKKITETAELYYYELTSTGYDRGKVIASITYTYYCTAEGLLILHKKNRKQQILVDKTFFVDKENENIIKRELSWGLSQIYIFSEIKKISRPEYLDPRAGNNIVAEFIGTF
jgi:hypothetical protein